MPIAEGQTTETTAPATGPAIEYPDRPEGPISAAIIAAGVGALVLGIATTLAEASTTVKDWLTWSDAVGPLSGKTIVAVIAWLIAWPILYLVYRDRPVESRHALVIALVLIALGVVGTFPPFFQAFAGD